MAQVHEIITPELQAFIAAQPMFFVATAPLEAQGHVNLSPKGLDCFRVLSPVQVAYLDVTGSGNETSAHLQENGRITFMFCAFNGPPRILRLYRSGTYSAAGYTGLGAGSVVIPRRSRCAPGDCGRYLARADFVWLWCTADAV